jgi:cell division protein FtsB
MKPQWIFVLALILLFVLLQHKLWVSPDGINQYWRVKKNIVQLNEENKQLQEKNDRLRAEVKDLKQGNNAIEEHARNELGLVKPGEKFYQIISGSS